MLRGRVLAAIAFALLLVANAAPVAAAQLDGVSMPQQRIVSGTRLSLNGIGLRTFSVLQIHVYVAGLYLEQRSANADDIARSKGLKLLVLQLLHDVSAEQARQAWRDGLADNCRAPCYLDSHEVQQFLAHVTSAQRGDTISLLFSPNGVRVSDNGRFVGSIDDPHFAEIILDTFIGPVPVTADLKRELLGSGGQSQIAQIENPH